MEAALRTKRDCTRNQRRKGTVLGGHENLGEWMCKVGRDRRSDGEAGWVGMDGDGGVERRLVESG